MAIVALPLTAEAFAPFGELVDAPDQGGKSANGGTARRHDFIGKLANLRPGAQANLCTVRCAPVAFPLEMKLLEKHPHSTQAFVPMVVSRYLVAVAPTGADGLPDMTGVRAFIAGPGQGINYRAGTWHHPLVVLDAPAQFAMFVWEDGTKEDCIVHALEPRVTVTG